MISIKLLRENKSLVLERLKKKHFKDEALIDRILEIDRQRRSAQTEKDSLLAAQKQASKNIGLLMKEGKTEEAQELRASLGEQKERIKCLEESMRTLEESFSEAIVLLPNIPAEIVPEGRSAEDNLCVKQGGPAIESLSHATQAHWDLLKDYKLIDFETGVKITAAGFPLYRGSGARLQRALISFFLDEASRAGYEEVIPPYLVNQDSAYATGQLPDKDAQMYHVGLDGLYLIPTAEVPVTNIFRDCILREEDLPLKTTAYSACFRREAGSYGKDVRGLNRLHQFDKVEIVRLDTSEHSYTSLDEMVSYVTTLVERLELPWRILRLCGGDMSFTSALTYDFEVYAAGQKKWLEVSSVSNFEDYQANRLQCRYRTKEGKIQLCHTLNGSALALPRIMAALLENNLYDDGIHIPKALQPYTGFALIKPAQ